MTDKALTLENLEYEDRGKDILNRLTLDVDMGTGLLVLTDSHLRARTLLSICASLLSPTGGQVSWFGRIGGHLRRFETLKLRRHIGWVHRGSSLVSNMSLMDNVTLGLVYYSNLTIDKAYFRVQGLMEKYGLHDFRRARPVELGFERYRLALYVREMAKQPMLYLFESPAMDLDADFPRLMEDVLSPVKLGQAALVMADQMVEVCLPCVDRILAMDGMGNRICSKAEFMAERQQAMAGDGA